MRREAGSATIAMAGIVGVLAVASLAVAALGALYATRAQAQAAADAGALAAAVATYPPASPASPRDAADEIVAENGAVLLGCSCARRGDLAARVVEVVAGVTVDVPVFGQIVVRGSSRAEFDPRRWLGP